MKSKNLWEKLTSTTLFLIATVLFIFNRQPACAAELPREFTADNKAEATITNSQSRNKPQRECSALTADLTEKEYLLELGMKAPAIDYITSYVSLASVEAIDQLSAESQLALRENIPQQARDLLSSSHKNYLADQKMRPNKTEPRKKPTIDPNLETRVHLLMRLLAFDALALSMKFRFDHQHRLLLEKIVKRQLKASDLNGLDYEQNAQIQYIVLTFSLMETMVKLDHLNLHIRGRLGTRSTHDLPSKIWDLSLADENLQALYHQYQVLLTLIDQIQQLTLEIEKSNRYMSFAMATSSGFVVAKRSIPELKPFSSLREFLLFHYLAQEEPPRSGSH